MGKWFGIRQKWQAQVTAKTKGYDYFGRAVQVRSHPWTGSRSQIDAVINRGNWAELHTYGRKKSLVTRAFSTPQRKQGTARRRIQSLAGVTPKNTADFNRGRNVGSFATRAGSWRKGKGGRFVGSGG